MIGKEDYIIIEPHPDDAVLSCGELMLIKKPIAIITLFIGKNKDNGTKNLTKDFNIDYINLGFPDIDLHTKKISFNIAELMSILGKTLEKYGGKLILSPVGGYHPAHNLARDSILKLYKDKAVFYADFPHYFKQKNLKTRFKLIKKIDGLFDEKIALFKKYYKTQRGLLFFNKKYFEMKPAELYFMASDEWW